MNEISVCTWRHLKIALESYLILLVWKITPWLNADLHAYLPKTVSLMPTVLRTCISLKMVIIIDITTSGVHGDSITDTFGKAKKMNYLLKMYKGIFPQFFPKCLIQLINETFQQKFKWNKHKEKLKRVILKTAVLWNIYLLWMPGTFVIKQVPIY